MVFTQNTRTKIWRGIKYAIATVIAAQATAVSSVVAIDNMRKKRRPPAGVFPYTQPRVTQIGDTHTTLYTYGKHVYNDMLADIKAAHSYVLFECFIVKDDETGNRFRAELINAARRGVDVYVILDTWGNANQNPAFRHFPKMEHLHTLLFPFIRTGILTGRSRDKGRDHRKILVVDGVIGYVGGYNIGDLYAHHWRDTHIRMQGPSTWELENSFAHMWNSYRREKNPVVDIPPAPEWNPRITAIENTPARNAYPIESMYISALNRARSQAMITMAYFIPDEPMLEALTRAAQRGVDVHVLIPEYSNHIYADWAGRPHYETLLRAGVHIWLFKEAMVHAKTMTIDGVWSTVGTANIDRLSFRGNFEINMEIYDAGFAQLMEESFEMDKSNSRELTLEEWNTRSALARVTESVIGTLAPLL